MVNERQTALERETVLAIRRVLDRCGGLSVPARRIRTADDLFAKGLTGLAAVDVLLAVEALFGVTFPPAMLNCRTVASIDSLAACIQAVQTQALAA